MGRKSCGVVRCTVVRAGCVSGLPCRSGHAIHDQLTQDTHDSATFSTQLVDKYSLVARWVSIERTGSRQVGDAGTTPRLARHLGWHGGFLSRQKEKTLSLPFEKDHIGVAPGFGPLSRNDLRGWHGSRARQKVTLTLPPAHMERHHAKRMPRSQKTTRPIVKRFAPVKPR